MDNRLVLATHNAHKLQELRVILAAAIPDFNAERLVDANAVGIGEPIEDGITFSANALIKARAAATASGLPALADDSGIAVDAMNGAPGIFSARWCGTHGKDLENLQLLLQQMADITDKHRGAAFVCAAALVLPNGKEIVCEGVLRGKLLHEPSGSHGFGYDPIFQPEGYEVSLAELDAAEKNRISHRFNAFTALSRTELIREALLF